jgi:hypothetical protein
MEERRPESDHYRGGAKAAAGRRRFFRRDRGKTHDRKGAGGGRIGRCRQSDNGDGGREHSLRTACWGSGAGTTFEEELKDDTGGRVRDYYWGGWRNEGGDSGERRLSKRRKLKFISDVDTNSILVVNATPSQLETVAALIKIYDKTLDEESISKRRTKVFQVRYSKAQGIADTIKEVFRDLLSSKDKVFQNAKGQSQQESRTSTYVRIYADSYDDKKKPTPVKAAFGGALSLGIDEISNTIVVSAQEELIDGIGEMIELLDNAARPTTTVQLHHVGPRVDPAALQKVLAEALSQPWPGNQRPEGTGKPSAKPAAKPAETPRQPQPPGGQPAATAASTGG